MRRFLLMRPISRIIVAPMDSSSVDSCDALATPGSAASEKHGHATRQVHSSVNRKMPGSPFQQNGTGNHLLFRLLPLADM